MDKLEEAFKERLKVKVKKVALRIEGIEDKFRY